MERYSRIAVITLCALGPLGCSAEHSTTLVPTATIGSLTDAVVQAELRDRSSLKSKERGVVTLRTMDAVAVADHQLAADLISGATVDDHVPVFVVQMTGGVFTSMRHPPNLPPPTGEVLTITYDARTFRVRDIGIDHQRVDLSRLHPQVVNLLQ